MTFKRGEFGIEVGGKFINARNAAHEENMKTVQQAMKLQIVEQACKFNEGRDTNGRRDRLSMVRDAEHFAESHFAETFDIHREELLKAVDYAQDSGNMEAVREYIDRRTPHYDSKEIQAKILEAEMDQKIAQTLEENLEHEEEYAHAM